MQPDAPSNALLLPLPSHESPQSCTSLLPHIAVRADKTMTTYHPLTCFQMVQALVLPVLLAPPSTALLTTAGQTVLHVQL